MLLAYPAPPEREPPDKGAGYLGITFHMVNDGQGGVEVAEVRPDGPAMGSGLRANDIIRKFNGETIVYESFPRTIVRMRPGTVIPIEVQRGSQHLTLKVKLGARPEDFPYPLPEADATQPQPQLRPLLKK
jgi:S1-C subfamily serine protease